MFETTGKEESLWMNILYFFCTGPRSHSAIAHFLCISESSSVTGSGRVNEWNFLLQQITTIIETVFSSARRKPRYIEYPARYGLSVYGSRKFCCKEVVHWRNSMGTKRLVGELLLLLTQFVQEIENVFLKRIIV